MQWLDCLTRKGVLPPTIYRNRGGSGCVIDETERRLELRLERLMTIILDGQSVMLPTLASKPFEFLNIFFLPQGGCWDKGGRPGQWGPAEGAGRGGRAVEGSGGAAGRMGAEIGGHPRHQPVEDRTATGVERRSSCRTIQLPNRNSNRSGSTQRAAHAAGRGRLRHAGRLRLPERGRFPSSDGVIPAALGHFH